MRTSRWLMTATAVFVMLAVAACCKKKEETTDTAADEAGTESVDSIPVPDPAEVAPDWKTKCPDAERPASGTVTALRNLDIHEKPEESSKNIGGITPGTWVNLLGVKQNWLCIDYPTAPGKLSPGWVVGTYTKRKVVVKDGGVEAAVPEAGAAVTPEAGAVATPEAGVVADSGSKLVALPDAGKTSTTPTTTTKAPPGIRPKVPRPPR